MADPLEGAAWAQVLADRHAEKLVEVELTEQCKSVLIGSESKGPGARITLGFEKAKEMVQGGFAKLTDLSSAIFPPAPKKPAKPAPPPRLDQPGPGRSYQGRMLPGKRTCASYWYGLGLESYGNPDQDIWLDEDTARDLVRAGKFKLISPDRLPAELEPVKLSVGPISRYGCSPLAGSPVPRPDY